MKNRDDAIVRKIVEWCNETQEAVSMFGDKEVFANNKVYRNAACMPVLQIGELCKLVSEEMRNQYTEIDWRGWCGIRDILAHQYSNLDIDKTWQIIDIEVPKLKSSLVQIICDIDQKAIDRIGRIVEKNKFENVKSEDVYHAIVDDTGVSLNAFSDEKIVEFIRNKVIVDNSNN